MVKQATATQLTHPKKKAPTSSIKRPVGHPPFVPTDDDRVLVKDMVVVGIDQERISQVLKIDRNTLRKHFRDELDLAMTQAHAKVGRNLMALTATHPLAAIYYLNNRLPHLWRDQRNVQVVIKDERPDLTLASDDDLAILEAASQVMARLTGPVVDGVATEVDEDTE